MTETTDVKAQQGGEVGAVDNEFYGKEVMQQVSEAMALNTEAGEVQFSRVALGQPGVPEIARSEPGYEVGVFIDSMSREVLTRKQKQPWLADRGIEEGDLKNVQCMQIVPVFKLPNEYIKWKDLDTEGRGFHFKTLDPTDQRVIDGVWPPIGKWQGEKGEAPPVTQNLNLLCLIIDQETRMALTNFIVFTFSKTSFSTGRKLWSAIDSHRVQGLTAWGRTYWLWNDVRTEDRQTWCEVRFAKGSLLSNPDKGAPKLERLAAAMAVELSDKEMGKTRQEAVINAAHIDQGDIDDSTATTIDASAADGVFDEDEENLEF